MTKFLIYLTSVIAMLVIVVAASASSNSIQFAGRSWHTYSGTGRLGQRWQPSHVAVKAGVLNITVSNQIGGGVALTDNQLYATYKVRFRMSKSAGTKYVLLLWPGKGLRPEIDFAEDDHRDNGRRALTTMSWHPDLINSHERHFGIQGKDFSNWHTATLIWKPGGLSFIIDTTLVKHVTNSSHIPMHLCIQADSWTTQGPPAILQVSNVSIARN